MEPTFLSLEEVAEIHADQLKRYGGTTGIRDVAALQSAVAVPQSGIGDEYFHRDLFEMAAAYLFHIVRNHPFVDGNKRAGAVAAVVFLTLNGVELSADEDAFEALVLSVAQGNADKTTVAQFFRDNSAA